MRTLQLKANKTHLKDRTEEFKYLLIVIQVHISGNDFRIDSLVGEDFLSTFLIPIDDAAIGTFLVFKLPF